MKVMSSLGTAGLIQTVAIDKAHEVEQSGRNFRKEFVEATKSLDCLIESIPNPLPRILMSATFRRSNYDSVASIFWKQTEQTARKQTPIDLDCNNGQVFLQLPIIVEGVECKFGLAHKTGSRSGSNFDPEGQVCFLILVALPESALSL